MPSECERTRLIGEIARLLAVERMPDDTRTAALTLIGWLARRMPGECAHALGVEEARLRDEGRRHDARRHEERVDQGLDGAERQVPSSGRAGRSRRAV